MKLTSKRIETYFLVFLFDFKHSLWQSCLSKEVITIQLNVQLLILRNFASCFRFSKTKIVPLQFVFVCTLVFIFFILIFFRYQITYELNVNRFNRTPLKSILPVEKNNAYVGMHYFRKKYVLMHSMCMVRKMVKSMAFTNALV